MKPFIINRKSWHYWLINTFTAYNHYNEARDFCSYTRRLVLAMVICVVVTCLVCAVAAMPLDFLWWICLSIYYGQWVTLGGPGGGFVMVCTIIAAIAAIAGVCYVTKRGLEWYNDYEPEPKEPGFVATWYKSTIGKFCIPVQYKDGK